MGQLHSIRGRRRRRAAAAQSVAAVHPALSPQVRASVWGKGQKSVRGKVSEEAGRGSRRGSVGAA